MIRVPLMHTLPWQMFGSTLIRSFQFIGSSSRIRSEMEGMDTREASRDVLRKVLQVFIIIGDNRNHSLAQTRLRPLAYRWLHTHQLRHRLVVLGNHHFLTRHHLVDEIGQLGLGFLNLHGYHDLSSVSMSAYLVLRPHHKGDTEDVAPVHFTNPFFRSSLPIDDHSYSPASSSPQ